jgi:hypothetical protein
MIRRLLIGIADHCTRVMYVGPFPYLVVPIPPVPDWASRSTEVRLTRAERRAFKRLVRDWDSAPALTE